MKKFLMIFILLFVLSCAVSTVATAVDTVPNGDVGVAFNKFASPEENDGLTPETPRARLGTLTDSTSTMSLLPRGGYLVAVGKTFVGVNYSIPRLAGPLTITSVWNGVDYRNPEPANNPSCAFKMAGSIALTISSDLIFDKIILFQEATQSTIHVTDGATLIVTDDVELMTEKSYHFRILADAGTTVILSAKAKEAFTLEGEGDFLDYGVENTTTTIKLTIGSFTGYVNSRGVLLDAAPIIRNTRMMLPVRFVAENLGADVGWDGVTSTATLTTDSVKIEITIGKNEAVVNGQKVALDAPAFIENNRTYLPVHFVAEKLGASVLWDAETSTATLTK